jgi:PAS domain S-box-containing protein
VATLPPTLPTAHFPTGYLAAMAVVLSAIILLIASAWLARSNLVGVLESDRLGDQISEAQSVAERVLSTLKDAETGQRGYLLTSDPTYLEPYHAARARLNADLARLGGASLADPVRDRRISHIRELAAMKLSELVGTVALVEAGHAAAAIDGVRTNVGRQEMDAIRAEVDALQMDANLRLAQARANTRSPQRWVEVVGLDGLAAGLLGVVALVQRRARLRIAATLAQLERFTRAFGLTQGFMRDLDGRIIFWSVGAERLYGYGQKGAMGRISHDLLRTGFPQPLPEIEAVLRRGGFWHGELSHRRADGTEVHVVSYWALHRGEAGEADAIIEVNNDITELKQQIEESERAQEMLRRSQQIETVGKLTGGIAHDFNNLLGVIILNAEALLDAIADLPEAAEQTRDILHSALSGAELTGRLSAFARQGPLQPQDIDLNVLLPNHVAMLRRMLGETIEVAARLTPGLWWTTTDPSQIGNALLNLALNARDAMPGGGRLTVETSNVHLDGPAAALHIEATAGDYVVLSVTDTGSGMAAGVAERATEPFFSTKSTASGSGLGLSMIDGFARQRGGHLAIESEVDVGTTVSLYLPRTRQGAATGPEASDATVRDLGGPDLGGQEAILVVDDNLRLRDVARRHLSALGYKVSCAENGPAALGLLRSGATFDLLFTDVVMPCDMSGYQLADAARRLHPDLRVLFTTGYADAVATSGNTDLGTHHMVRKPYRRTELADKVRAVLGTPQAAVLGTPQANLACDVGWRPTLPAVSTPPPPDPPRVPAVCGSDRPRRPACG